MSIPSFNEEVRSDLKEKDFYALLIGRITGLASNITCFGDPEEEFDVSTKGGSYIPEFTFKVNNVEFFKIVRPVSLDTATYSMDFKLTTGNTVSSTTIKFNNQSAVLPDVDTARRCFFGYIVSSNEKLISFNIKSSNATDNATMVFSISGSKNHRGKFGDTNYGKYFTNLILYETESPYNGGKFRSRFSYAAPAGNVDYIKSSVYTELSDTTPVTGDGATKRFDITSMFDCTAVTPGSTVSLKDGNYYAVDTNQLVKIS